MHSSKRLRENIQQTMAQSKSDMDSQKNATEYAMRKRIHETEQAHDELCWQRKNVRILFIYSCETFLLESSLNVFILKCLNRPRKRLLNWRSTSRTLSKRSGTRTQASNWLTLVLRTELTDQAWSWLEMKSNTASLTRLNSSRHRRKIFTKNASNKSKLLKLCTLFTCWHFFLTCW